MEVVVNVHAAQTTTSEAKPPRYYYNLLAKLNDSRKKPHPTSQVVLEDLPKSTTASRIRLHTLVVDAKSSWASTPTQPQPPLQPMQRSRKTHFSVYSNVSKTHTSPSYAAYVMMMGLESKSTLTLTQTVYVSVFNDNCPSPPAAPNTLNVCRHSGDSLTTTFTQLLPRDTLQH